MISHPKTLVFPQKISVSATSYTFYMFYMAKKYGIIYTSRTKYG